MSQHRTSAPSDKPHARKPAETPQQRRARREATFPSTVTWHLEALDRRRDAARRLNPLCPDDAHDHDLRCYDPIGIGA